MASTTTFGDFPGVRVSTSGGAITGVVVGRQQKLVVIGRGDPAEGSANANEPTEVNSRRDADRKFGTDTELALGMKEALANGAHIDYLYGLMPEVTSVTDESFSGSSSGTLANAPIVEDKDTITFEEDTTTDGSGDTTITVNFVYEDAPATPSDSDTVNLNPNTGDWVADSSGDYFVSYDSPDWANAFDNIGRTVRENEVGIYACLNEAHSVASELSGVVSTHRGQYKMVQGVAPAEPNATADDGTALIDPSNYDDTIDNDAMYLVGPSREEGGPKNVLGGVAGLMAGSELNESIHDTALSSVGRLADDISKADADTLRNAGVIPVRNLGSVKLRSNISTSTDTDWKRDFWRRRIVDQTILIAKQVGEQITGRINNEDTRESAQELIAVEMRGLQRSGLIRPNNEETSDVAEGGDTWYVDVYEVSADEVGIDIGITPLGIVRRVDVSITIDR